MEKRTTKRNKSRQINIIGNILDSSGFSVHTRELANSLSKVCDVRLQVNIPQGSETMLRDKELSLIKKKEDNPINLIITNPIYWKYHLTQDRNWVFLVFEGDKLPKSYVRDCLDPRIEYIFVPSKHTYNALENSEQVKDNPELLEKTKIIPHGVDLSKFYPKEGQDKFTFLANKGFRNLEDRGGIQYLIKAYLEEFSSKDNVRLIVKINPVYGVYNLNELLEQIKPNKKDLPDILINTEYVDYIEMVKFYNAGDVFVSPTRAEAYNIPCIEAMACGKPVITSNFGGQTDFVNEENGWLISGSLEEVKHELQYEGVKWLTPNIPELKQCLRQAFENKDIVEFKSKNALETAKQNTWDKTSKKIKELI